MNFHQQIVDAINAPNAPSMLCTSASFPLEVRCAIYRSTTFNSRVNALLDSFPRCRQEFGNDFVKLAASYARKEPASQANLELYGETLPRYAKEAQFPEWAEALARLEWHVHLAELNQINAPNPVEPLATLAHLDEPELQHVQLIAAPGFSLLSLPADIAPFWADRSNPAPAFAGSPTAWHVVFHHRKVRVQAITSSQVGFAELLYKGLDFVTASGHAELTTALQNQWIKGWRYAEGMPRHA